MHVNQIKLLATRLQADTHAMAEADLHRARQDSRIADLEKQLSSYYKREKLRAIQEVHSSLMLWTLVCCIPIAALFTYPAFCKEG